MFCWKENIGGVDYQGRIYCSKVITYCACEGLAISISEALEDIANLVEKEKVTPREALEKISKFYNKDVKERILKIIKDILDVKPTDWINAKQLANIMLYRAPCVRDSYSPTGWSLIARIESCQDP